MSEKVKILLAEDDYFVRDIYQTKLSHEGFEIIMAENGKEAVEKLKKETPDIIILDIMMPYMNGTEALKIIRAEEKWKDIPIIMLTNLSQKEDMEKSMEIGADEYIIKAHFTPSEVVEKIRSLLMKKKK